MKITSSKQKPHTILIGTIIIIIVLLALQSFLKRKNKVIEVPVVEQTTSLNLLQLTVKEKHFKKLKKKRDRAIAAGILEKSDSDFVPAIVSFNGVDYPANIRLKGDWTDHLLGDKWSFRVKLKNDKTIMGMRKFSIHHPKTRGYLNEWLYHKAFKAEGLIGLRYNFVEGAIHIKMDNSSKYINKEVGIYAVEESFDKRTIESNGRKESIILKFTEAYSWAEVKRGLEVGNPSGIRYNPFYNREIMREVDERITTFSLEKVLADTVFSRYFKLSKNLLEEVRRGKRSVDEVFDTKKLAMYTALLNLCGAKHGWSIINLRFYYNPITSRLEPIAFDGDAGWKSNRFIHFRFTDQKRDTVYMKELLHALREVSKPAYLEKLIKQHETEIHDFTKVLKEEFNEQVFHHENLKHNQKILRREIIRIKKELRSREFEKQPNP